MKIFGGGGSREGKPKKKVKKVNPNSKTEDISYVAKQMKTQSKQTSAKKQNKPKDVVTGVLCVIASVIAITIAGGAAFLVFAAKKPEISNNNNNVNVPISTPASEEIAINLNVGDRIDDFFTFAVCATDIDGTRTDNIMVVAFDTNKHTVNIMNIPRDVMSNVNKTGASKKINAAYSRGIEQTKKQIAQVMGFVPDKYIVVDFQGIADIVDVIGGIDYEIPFPMMYSDPVQKLEINFPFAGMRHMNGEEVVEFLRWRKNGPGYTQLVPEEYLNGDETRIAKQQEFLIYLAKQILTPKNAFKFKDIANVVSNSVKTDITAREMLWLAGQAFQVDPSTGIKMFTLPGYAAMSTAGTDAALSFYFVNESAALEIINQYFNPYDAPIKYLDLVSGPTKPQENHDYDEDHEESKNPNYYDDDDDDGVSSNMPEEGYNENLTPSGSQENGGIYEGGYQEGSDAGQGGTNDGLGGYEGGYENSGNENFETPPTDAPQGDYNTGFETPPTDTNGGYNNEQPAQPQQPQVEPEQSGSTNTSDGFESSGYENNTVQPEDTIITQYYTQQ